MILVDATPLQTGHRYRGIGAYAAGFLDALIGELASPRLRLMIQPPHTDDHPALASLLRRAHVSPITIRRPRWGRSRLEWLYSLLTLGPCVAMARPRLYHALEAYGLVKIPGVTTVATLHDLIPFHTSTVAPERRTIDHRLGLARYARLLRRVEMVLAVSEATRNDAIGRLGVDADRIRVVYGACDDARFSPRPASEVDAVVERYKLRRPYILHVGSADPYKNTRRAIDAFDLFLQRTHDNCALYIPGMWPVQPVEELQNRHRRLLADGKLGLLGYVAADDLPALYCGAEMMLFPSLVEGFGIPVLEAMRCGVPVVTSNVSSLPEVAGEAALLVDPYDTEAMAHAMESLATDSSLRARLVERGHQRAAQFTFQRTARETLAVYREFGADV